jgi:hypothetical protein
MDDQRVSDSPREILFRNSSADGGQRQSVGAVGDRSLNASLEGSIFRPRAIPKTSALAVACVVSRMGVANRERKRRTAARLAQKFSRPYTVLPDSPAPDASQPSAFRVVVSRPCPSSSTVRPLDSSRLQLSGSRGVSAGGAPAEADISLAFSEKRSRHNNMSTYTFGLSMQESSLANISGVGSLDATDGSALSRRGHGMNETFSSAMSMDRSLTAKEFSERALSSINSALKPLGNPSGLSHAARDHFTPVDASFDVKASCPASMRVGDKRVRESFAPEPSSTRKVCDRSETCSPIDFFFLRGSEILCLFELTH